MRPLLEHARPHGPRLALALVLGLGFTASTLAVPLVVRDVLDSATGRVGVPMMVLTVLLLASAGLGFGQWMVLGRLAENVVLDARSTAIRRLLGATVPALMRSSTGDLVTRVTADTVLLREAAATSLVMIVNSTIALLGVLAMMAVLDLVMLAAMVGALVLIGATVAVLLPTLGREQAAAQAEVGALGGLLEGVLSAVRTVKADDNQRREQERIIAHARRSKEHRVRAVLVEAVAVTAAGAGIQFAVVAVLALGGVRVGAGELAVSTLVAFLLYAFQIVEPATSLALHLGRLQTGAAAAHRLAELTAIPAEPAAEHGCAITDFDESGADELLRLEGVVAGYGGRAVLRGLDLVVPHRGHIAVVGPSGAGKSTAFAVLLRFVEATSGTATMHGKPLAELSVRTVRRQIAYVEQSAPLLPGSLRENVRYRHPDADDEEVSAALRAVGLAELVARLPHGLDTLLDGEELSGGERQRVAFARACLRPPAVLLLDEATAQLDGISEAAVRRVVADLARRIAVVTIAHRLSTVVDADRIYVVEDGRTRASGSHVELLASDATYRGLVAGLRIPVAS
ncbi:ABC transporter ATP-binding protein [Microbacteriaceae bacterium VKM Ac-2854]|nr:ABC transporter ATP-binding protein [Microbacteriaceae bacterium VKM Ac-2854]